MAKSLSCILYEFMTKKGIENSSDIWRTVGFGRKNWHNLITKYETGDQHPPKIYLLHVAIGMQLSLDETKELLASQGYTLTDDRIDSIFVTTIMSRRPARSREEAIINAAAEATAIRKFIFDN